MAQRDIVTVGASAGGVEALTTLVRGLPSDLAAAVFIVMHIPPTGRSFLPDILRRAGPMPVLEPSDGETIRPGRMYVAPPNRHLVLENGIVRLVLGARENSVRPAADVLFRSAAQAYGPRVVGIVLSGTGSDGSNGLEVIKLRGGTTIAQDLEDAAFPSMPRSAIARTCVDHVVPLADMPALLLRLVGRGIRSGLEDHMTPSGNVPDLSAPGASTSAGDELKRIGSASGFTCPDCFGPLWELRDDATVHFECQVGHSFNLEAMADSQAVRVENALWTATNVLTERAKLLRHLAERFAPRSSRLQQQYEEQARRLEAQAALVRGVIEQTLRAEVTPEVA